LSEHPTPTELAAFARGDLPRRSFLRTARHLLRCSACRVLLAPHYAHLLPAELAEPSPQGERVYDDRLDRAFAAARAAKRQVLREEARRRRVLTLLARGGGLETLLAHDDLPLRGLGLLQALLDHGWAIRHEDPQEMVKLTRYAVTVAAELDSRQCGPQEHMDWQARAWGELGNAYRAADKLDEAERAFGCAFDFLVQGTGDPRLKAKLYEFHASYYGTRRQFTFAFAALDVVFQAYQELKEPHLASRALLVKAVYSFYEGNIDTALQLNRKGLEGIDKQRDPELFLMSVHNRILFILETGRYRDARMELFRYLPELSNTGGRAYAIRLLWLRARISDGLQEWSKAELAFLEVKEGWEEMEMPLAAALASFELALICMRQGRYPETETLVLDAAEVFLGLRIQREAIGAVMVLRDSFERKLGTLEHLEEVVTFLRRWHLDPSTKFEPRED
jgi:tetratricopeptide (TPR) repeat protein